MKDAIYIDFVPLRPYNKDVSLFRGRGSNISLILYLVVSGFSGVLCLLSALLWVILCLSLGFF